MTKIWCVGDVHLADKPPVNTTEAYTDDIIAMLTWIVEEANRRTIDAVVLAGDIFDKKAPSKNSHALVLKMLSVVALARDLDVDLQIVCGNHDLTNDRYDLLYETQPLGVLFAAGAKELRGWHDGGLPLYGIPWQQDWDATLEQAFKPVKDTEALVVTHASIFPPGQEPPYDHLDLDRLATAAGALSVYHGHIHDFHGAYRVGETAIANMGALARGSLTESHVTRKIQIAEWDAEAQEFEAIDVPHKPASEVLKIEEGTARKQARRDAEDFLSALGSRTLAVSSTEAIIAEIKATDVADEVKDVAITHIEEHA